MKLIFKLRSLFLLTALMLFNCNSTDTNNDADNNIIPDEGPASISVKLMDDPGDFDNVFVEVVDVMIKYESDSGENDDNGWISLDAINTGIYDLLELTGGVDVLLVDNFDVEPGTLKQIRLVLGEQNSVVIDGEEHPLNTPSAQQSGLKVHINQPIAPNFNYTFILDFVVEESIVIAGNSGNINLKPVLRASLEASSGTISGTVLPADVDVSVIADNGDVQASAFTDDAGNFLIAGLPAGSYSLTIMPDPDSGYGIEVIDGVEVVVGANTDVGEIILEALPGSISGVVLPADVDVEVTADNGVDVQVTVVSDETGNYLIEGLPAGNYTVTLTPDAGSGLTEQVIENVEVTAGANTDLGETILE